MPNLNKAFIAGHLGADPEMNTTSSGREVCNFRLAATEKWTKDGEKHERTEWFRVVAWGKTAELCGRYLEKGRAVLVEGKIQTREWEDKEGNRRWTTEIVADRVQFLSGGGAQAQRNDDPPEVDDEDIPF